MYLSSWVNILSTFCNGGKWTSLYGIAVVLWCDGKKLANNEVMTLGSKTVHWHSCQITIPYKHFKPRHLHEVIKFKVTTDKKYNYTESNTFSITLLLSGRYCTYIMEEGDVSLFCELHPLGASASAIINKQLVSKQFLSNNV